MLLCFPLVSSADPERGVNDDGFFFLFLSAYLSPEGMRGSIVRLGPISALTVLLV